MQPQYPTQPMPAQYPQQPAFPVQPAYPPQGYAPAPTPAYPQIPQQYAPAQPMPQYPAAPATPPPPPGTLDGFFSQPSGGGGPSFKFNGKPIGTSYAGIVARTVTNADVRHQTNNAGVPQTYKDGRPKLVMVVPMQVQPSPEFPEGVAGWWVKGQARDELARAMSEAGAPAGPPEAGAAIRVTLVGIRPVPNMNPQFQYRVEYVRPNGAAPAVTPQPAAQAAPVMSTATGQPVVHHQQVPAQPMPNPHVNPDGTAAPWQPAPAAPIAADYQPPAQPPVQQQLPIPQQAPVQQPVEQVPAAAPAGFNADQAALFAKLTGQQAA